jgi:PAS domain S-box-containing protein
LGLGQVLSIPPLPVREIDELGKALTHASSILAGANAALKRSEARIRGIVESAKDAIIMVDDTQTIVLFNPAACTMFACPVEQAVGSPITRFIPERLHAGYLAYVHKHRNDEKSYQAVGTDNESVALRYNGEEFSVDTSYSNVIESGVIHHILIVRDVTERIRTYNALKRSNLDLQQFAYIASHDLKTPLRSIGGFVQVLERNYADKLDEKALSLIRRTLDATQQMGQLTDDLLSFAQINSTAKSVALVNCGELVKDVIGLLETEIHNSGAMVTTDELPDIMGDRVQLTQLFLNLIGNGIKYCRDRTPTVHLSAQMNEGEWVFSVTDNGIGIDAKHHDKIFEVFKRLHTQKEYPGTGIGLAVCRRVVERHGGRVWIASELGAGSTFSFTIPDTRAESTSP